MIRDLNCESSKDSTFKIPKNTGFFIYVNSINPKRRTLRFLNFYSQHGYKIVEPKTMEMLLRHTKDINLARFNIVLSFMRLVDPEIETLEAFRIITENNYGNEKLLLDIKTRKRRIPLTENEVFILNIPQILAIMKAGDLITNTEKKKTSLNSSLYMDFLMRNPIYEQPIYTQEPWDEVCKKEHKKHNEEFTNEDDGSESSLHS